MTASDQARTTRAFNPSSGYIRVPNAETYARNTYEERQRLYAALKALLGDYAMSEIERPD